MFVLASALAPWLTDDDPAATQFELRFAPPSLRHPLGTDSFGRDLLSRVLYGKRLARALESTFARAHHVRQRLPIALSDDSEAEPDVAVVSGGIEDYARAHPASPVLIAEIADSTVGFDRLRKQPIYARAGVPEYWILNLVDAVLEVYREPSWAGSSMQLRLGRDDIVSPVGAPNAVVRVAELLPTTPSAG